MWFFFEGRADSKTGWTTARVDIIFCDWRLDTRTHTCTRQIHIGKCTFVNCFLRQKASLTIKTQNFSKTIVTKASKKTKTTPRWGGGCVWYERFVTPYERLDLIACILVCVCMCTCIRIMIRVFAEEKCLWHTLTHPLGVDRRRASGIERGSSIISDSAKSVLHIW